MTHHQVASPSLSSKGSGTISDKIFPISQLYKIMESLGVLWRNDGQLRKEMEEQTLQAMSHLPTVVTYGMDLSNSAGDKCSSVADQLVLRKIPSQALDQCGIKG
jgi:hypothetical protein